MPAPKSTLSARRASLYTLGCRLNQAETALLAGQLAAAGFTVVPWGAPADLVVINSCTVTGAAARKSRHTARLARRRHTDAFIVLAGCDAELAADAWSQEPAVNLVVPNPLKRRLVELLPAKLDPAVHLGIAALPPAPLAESATLPAFAEPGCGLYVDKTRANLKIQEGCNLGCSYCIIPAVRGPPRSRAWDDVLRETAALATRGHREMVLTGINLALYDDHGRRLPDLITAVLDVAPGFRVRLSSLEPGPEIEPVVELMAREPRLCRHLHLPLQYGEDGILRAMRRTYTVADFAAAAANAVRRVPGLCLGTDVIVGFPGETDDAFARCRDTIRSLPLAYLHVFPFSPRPGTPAAQLPGRVPGARARVRVQTLETLGRGAALAFAQSQLGQRLTVLTEAPAQDGRPHGVTDNYLPVELVDAPPDLGAGRFVEAEIVEVLPDGTARGATALEK